MRNKILYVKFKLLESVSSGFSLYVEFKHLSESSEIHVLISFKFAHWDCSLGFVFLLNNIKYWALSILLHGALGSLFEESVNCLISRIFIF